jgi:M6 family metalloprotease-like protein
LKYTGTSSYASSWEPTWNIVESATSWYANKYSNDMSEFDSNNDGVIDAVWFVYSAPDYSKKTSLDSTDFWAYTYSDLLSYEQVVNSGGKITSCIPFRYSWASYDFMYSGYGNTGRDAHTFIHETGHMMGLDDYYVGSTTTKYPTNYGPMGRLDMMDFNIIDHDAYSKFALGWIKPYVVSGATTITLNPSATTGQAILLPTSTNGWNGSAFDEYMLLEFYTPTLLNKKDSDAAYPDNKAQGFTENGVRVYHVDSRLWGINGKTGGYTDTLLSSSSAYTLMAHSNGAGYNEKVGTNLGFRLVQEIDCTKKRNFDTQCDNVVGQNGKTYQEPLAADNTTLFQAGNTFSFSAYKGSFPLSTMNDGNTFPFSVSFSSMSSDSITVDISAN